MGSRYVVEHLNHLCIVAEVCREIGVAAWLDQHDPGSRQQVSVGTATVALVLNGLGFSHRQLYLVPQFFADKPVEHLLGSDITADALNDDCLGRILAWLFAHDVTLAFIMTLCLLVYKLAEVRVRQQLAATRQTVPDQLRKPTARPTLRWLFQCFEGIEWHHTVHADESRSTEVLRLTTIHRLVLHLLGPAYENSYLVF
jgi:transposase